MAIKEETIITVTCDKCETKIDVGYIYWDFSYYGYIFCDPCFKDMSAYTLAFDWLHQGEKYKHEMIVRKDSVGRASDVCNPS